MKKVDSIESLNPHFQKAVLTNRIKMDLWDKADRLGIEFRVKYLEEQDTIDILFRTKKHLQYSNDLSKKNHDNFTEFAQLIVKEKYRKTVQFSYPNKKR